MNKVKVNMWSHCSECWMHYRYFDSVEDANNHIEQNGQDPRYFQVDAKE